MSAPMIPWLPAVKGLYKYMTTSRDRAPQSISIHPVEIHDIESMPEKRPRTLKHLLKANHSNFAIFSSELQYHNHMPHILCSAYLLGANTDQLHHIYDVEAKVLDAWSESPAQISDDSWKDHLGDRRYERAYVDFFEDELALKYGYDWRRVMDEYVFGGERPLINCVISGIGHPLIHLGYAYEMSSREIAMEALGQIACSYNELHKYIDDSSYTKVPNHPSTSPIEILQRIANDDRFDGIFQKKGDGNFKLLFEKHESLVLEYWNAWKIVDPVKQFQESQEAAVSLLVSTVPSNTHAYDFFLVHLLTTSHAVRILLPMIPERFHINLVRQWWLLTVGTYIGQLRPKIDDGLIGRPDLKGKHWRYVHEKAINGPWATDAHYVKAIRALQEAALTWGDPHEWYLTAAIKFADEFAGWVGFE